MQLAKLAMELNWVGILDVEKEINVARKREEERAYCLSRTLVYFLRTEREEGPRDGSMHCILATIFVCLHPSKILDCKTSTAASIIV